MNIIFGTELANRAQDRYTILELDTLNLIPTNEVVTAYCVIGDIPMEEMPLVDSLKQQHADLMAQYKKQNWQFCETAIADLTGKWGGELDSFYTELSQRILQLKQQELSENWTGRINKTVEVV